MTVHNTVCDNCKKVKGEANHWFVLYVTPEGHFSSLSMDGGLSQDFCGEECVGIAVANLVSKLGERKKNALDND